MRLQCLSIQAGRRAREDRTTIKSPAMLPHRLCCLARVALGSALGVLGVIEHVAQAGDAQPAAALAKQLFERVALDTPGLEKTRELVADGKTAEALDAYRDASLARAARLELGQPVEGCWSWAYTKADDLLEGWVHTGHYGERGTTRYNIGRPGEVVWHGIPEDGYDTVLRDLSTMHWANKLAIAYRETRDPRYLKAWFGYWTDFAANFKNSYAVCMSDPARRDRVNKTIPWSTKSLMYHGCRLNNFLSWLPMMAGGAIDQAEAIVSGADLAHILLYLSGWEVGDSMYRLKHWGAPNQVCLCAQGVMRLAVALPDFRDAGQWSDSALTAMRRYLDGAGYLADGTDAEQSFNYNPSLIGTLEGFIVLGENPPFDTTPAGWVAEFREKRDYRERFLPALKMPDGRLPTTGCDNHWGYDRSRAIVTYNERRAKLSPLQAAVDNQLLGDGTGRPPAFTSICFPYGGYCAMRTGWAADSLYGFMKSSRPGAGHMREGGNGLQLWAYGDYLLVNANDKAYSQRGTYNGYFHSTVSQNSVSVDGYSQRLRGKPATPEVTQPIPARWHTSARFDVAEGFFAGTYGGFNYLTNKTEKDVSIEDVRHERQLLLLRREGLWIVTDRVLSTGRHTYSQSWNFRPDFAESEVTADEARRTIHAHHDQGADLVLRQFGPPPVTYRKYYGVHTETDTVGWAAIEKEVGVFVAKADVHASWTGSGDQLLVTLIEPVPPGRTSRITSCTPADSEAVTGFDASLDDGCTVSYRTSPTPAALVAGELRIVARALLVVRSPEGGGRGIALDAAGDEGMNRPRGASPPKQANVQSFEFELTGKALSVVAPIRIPTTFRWKDGPDGLRPVYAR